MRSMQRHGTTGLSGLFALVLFTSVFAIQVNAQDPPQTPGEQNDWEQLSSHQEVTEFYRMLARTSDQVDMRRIGESRQGRPLFLMMLSNPVVNQPWQAHRSGKPVVFIGAQIHGDEPAGKEGLMTFARELAFGELNHLLDEVIFLFVPQMNPDGGELGEWGTRANAAGYNLNRDFPRLDNPESEAIAYEVLIPWRPHVVIDAHELPGPPRIYDFYTWHPNSPDSPYGLFGYADNHLIPDIVDELEDSGYTHIIYHTPGGLHTEPEEGISVPVYGRTLNDYAEAQGSISILFESLRQRDARIGIEDRANRHFVAMRALGRHVAENSDEVIHTVKDARRVLVERGRTLSPDDSIAVTTEPVASQEIDYRVAEFEEEEGVSPWNWEPTGDTLELTVPLIDSAKVTSSRMRPAGYVIEAHRSELAGDLARHGVQVHKLQEAVDLPVESFQIESLEVADGIYEGYVERFVEGEMHERRVSFTEGAYFVSTAQPNAALIFKLLEPEDANSYTTVGWVGTETGTGQYLPIHRLMERRDLPKEKYIP